MKYEIRISLLKQVVYINVKYDLVLTIKLLIFKIKLNVK